MAAKAACQTTSAQDDVRLRDQLEMSAFQSTRIARDDTYVPVLAQF
jgi:hypothetical protein